MLFGVVFSYLFVIGLAAACVILPFELLGLAAEHTSSFWAQALILLVFGVLIAIIILWSLVPRRHPFTQPGPELNLERHSRLRKLLQQTTSLLAERLPETVYLSGEANAWVTQRGGVLGIGSHRVLCLGLPVLAVLSVDELRSVIAHECAHYYAGDTWLGPRVYSIRSAMSRLMANLNEESSFVTLLGRFGFARVLYLSVASVLTTYWKVFFRLAQYVSRLQEYRCDELAAFIAGTSATISGLEKLSRVRMIERTFWVDVIHPALQGGVLPPLAESFQELENSPAIREATQSIYRQLAMEVEVDAYATHPPLRLRLNRLERLAGEADDQSDMSAISLLEDLDVIERELVGFLFREVNAQGLRRADWDELGSTLYVPMWRSLVQSHPEALAVYRVAQIPYLLANLPKVASRMRDPVGTLLSPEQRLEKARELLWKALGVKLVDAGWKVEARPGALRIVYGQQTITPGALVTSLSSGELDLTWWENFCEEFGLTQEKLAIL